MTFRNIKYLYAALTIATLTMAATAGWLISGIVQESARLESGSRDTLIGIASQTNYELHQLIDALDQYTETAPRITKKQLITRFDILWSREKTNSSGKVGAHFPDIKGVPAFQKILKTTLRQTEDKIVNLKVGDIQQAALLRDLYQVMTPMLQGITIEAIQQATSKTSYLHKRLQNVSFWISILLASMLITGFVVAAILWNERRTLNNLTRHLEERVDERTHDLRKTNQALKAEVQERRTLEAKLVQSQKMEIVGQLTGGIAHDFNNLLAIIQGNAELLDSFLGDKDRRLIRPILKSTQRGSDLTQRLLAFSRKQPLHPQTLDLAELVANMSELLDRSLGETVRIHVTAEENLWPALADAGQVENALLNLAVNARHAMPQGGNLSIKIGNVTFGMPPAGLQDEMSPGDYIYLSISDNGEGMSEEVRERAFEPFFTTKDTGKGSGLGLSMVYGFAQQSGGFVELHSELGIGTTVRLFLPRGIENRPGVPVTCSASDIPKGQGENILILEDDPEVLQLAEKLLQSLNYMVITANNIETAREVLVSRQNIDLVLSDVILPGGTSGPDFFKKNSSLISNIDIIYMSGYPAEATPSPGNSEFWDANDILLSKPFRRGELARLVKQVLSSKRQ